MSGAKVTFTVPHRFRTNMELIYRSLIQVRLIKIHHRFYDREPALTVSANICMLSPCLQHGVASLKHMVEFLKYPATLLNQAE